MVNSERCLCGLMHVTTGTLVLGAVMIVSGMISAVTTIDKIEALAFIAGVLISFFLIAIGSVTVYAVIKKNHELLWPFMVYQALSLVAIYFCAFVTVVLQFYPVWVAEKATIANRYKVPEDHIATVHITLTITTVVIILFAFVPIWFMNTAKRCHDIFLFNLRVRDISTCRSLLPPLA